MKFPLEEEEAAKEKSVCLRRCQSFFYSLSVDEEAYHDDAHLQRRDVYLYFSSRFS